MKSVYFNELSDIPASRMSPFGQIIVESKPSYVNRKQCLTISTNRGIRWYSKFRIIYYMEAVIRGSFRTNNFRMMHVLRDYDVMKGLMK